MAEEEVLQAGVPEAADGGGAFVVAQVTVALTYPHLKVVGVGASYEHS